MKAVIKSDWNLQPKHKHNLLHTTKQTPQNSAQFSFSFFLEKWGKPAGKSAFKAYVFSCSSHKKS